MTTFCIVDDSRVVRRAARRMLESLGFEVSEAESGAEALEKCREAMPDAILLDWNMPVMDGISFLRALRREPEGAGPKVLFCTTEGSFAHISEALEAGADEFIIKPFDEEILRDKLELAALL
jgi:two-component system chemotaxis response regulator CheY